MLTKIKQLIQQSWKINFFVQEVLLGLESKIRARIYIYAGQVLLLSETLHIHYQSCVTIAVSVST